MFDFFRYWYCKVFFVFVRNFKWGKDSNPCEVRTVVSDTCLSIGDALRELDAEGLIQSDFVLVNGDLVSNINLKVILEEHKYVLWKLSILIILI